MNRKNFIIVLLFGGMLTPCVAQNNSAAKKSTVTKKATVAKKQSTAPLVITVDDPAIVNGHVAFLGVPVKQPEAEITKQLKVKGLVPKTENGFQFLGGTAYGVQVKVFVDSEDMISVRETKAYTKAQARNRVMAYQKAFLDATKGNVAENTMNYNSNEEGGVTIQTSGGNIEIHYSNQDEVEFSSKYFDVIITFVQN